MGRYIGWPTITRTSSGELLAVFSGDREGHFCPWGKAHIVRSSDDGETWSAPQVIRDSPIDDRDAGVIVTALGTLLVTWFSSVGFESRAEYQEYASSVTTQTRERFEGNWSACSALAAKT